MSYQLTLIDGGLSTQLESLGADVSGPLWTARTLIENPKLITAAHAAFVAAGAQVVITSSYQLSVQGLLKAGIDFDITELLIRTITCARAANAPLVAASVGPYGAVLHDGSEYRGNYEISKQELLSFHAPRIAGLLVGCSDLFAIETIPSLVELEVLAELVPADFPVWVAFSLADEFHLADGTELEVAAKVAQTIGSNVAIGVNCVQRDWVLGALKVIHGQTGGPTIAYPNAYCAGEWSSGSGWVAAGESAGISKADVVAWREQGLKFVGGCCGFDALLIEKLALDLTEC